MSTEDDLAYRRFKHLTEEVGPMRSVNKIMLAINCIDAAKTEGLTAKGHQALEMARRELVEVLGINKEPQMTDGEITKLVLGWRDSGRVTDFATLWNHYQPYAEEHCADLCDRVRSREYGVVPAQLMGAAIALFTKAIAEWDLGNEIRFNTFVVIELRGVSRYLLHLINEKRVARGEGRLLESELASRTVNKGEG